MAVEERTRVHGPLACGVPQGLILSPALLNICMHPQLAQRFELGCQRWAKDTQPHLLMASQLHSTPEALAGRLQRS